MLITGKNGSGKTSVLLALKEYLTIILNSQLQQYPNKKNTLNALKKQLSNLEKVSFTSNISQQIINTKCNINIHETWLKNADNAKINFKNEEFIWGKINAGSFIIVFFDAKRYSDLKVPSGINKIDLKQHYSNFQDKANQHFLQYIVNLKADRAFAKDEGNESHIVASIDKWFYHFQERLRDIFDSPTLELKFDRKNYNFQTLRDMERQAEVE